MLLFILPLSYLVLSRCPLSSLHSVGENKILVETLIELCIAKPRKVSTTPPNKSVRLAIVVCATLFNVSANIVRTPTLCNGGGGDSGHLSVQEPAVDCHPCWRLRWSSNLYWCEHFQTLFYLPVAYTDNAYW